MTILLDWPRWNRIRFPGAGLALWLEQWHQRAEFERSRNFSFLKPKLEEA